MAVTETLTDIKANMLLYNGISPTGKTLTVNASIGLLKPSEWDATKAYNIVLAYSAVGDTSIQEIRSIKTYSVNEG